MNTITLHFFKANSKQEINKVLLVFALLFMTIQTSWGQSQVIGSFPSVEGGIETQAVGAPASSSTSTLWGAKAGTIVYSIASTSPRTGSRYLITNSGASTSKYIISPFASLATGTAYTIQFWYRTAAATTTSTSYQGTMSVDAGSTFASSPVFAFTTAAANTWYMKTLTVTTSGTAGSSGMAGIRTNSVSTNTAVDIDDLVVYAGAADSTPPTGAATSPTTAVVSGTSLNVNWTGLLNAGDGGGYVIVRSTSSAAVTLNQNGVYAVGNTSSDGVGTVVAIVPGVAGANTFTDTGLTSGVTYYYSIFATDKAFNYASAVTCNGTPTSGLTPPTLTADTTLNNVDNNIDITFTDNATWRGLVTAVKIGGTTLTPTTDYVITAGNLQLKPSGLNALLTTSGSKAVTVEATGYAPAAVTQIINPGAVVAANSSATISAALALSTTQTITITARDKYNNLVPGYSFIYDAVVTNANGATTESYTIDSTPRTSTLNDALVSTATNASGVTTLTVTLPATVDPSDGVSVQIQLADGITNVGTAFIYIQLPPQTITFGALASVTYGGAAFNLTATSSSGLTVTYTSSNTAVATVSGNTVTILTPGTTIITASQAGNASYSAAIPVTQTLTVNTKSLTISSAAASNKVYNGTTAAVITGTLAGIVGADVVTFTGTGTFATSNVGTGIAVTSTCTLGGANASYYNLIQPTGLSANITIASQTISFPGPLLNYVGFADFTPPATSTGTTTITYTSSNPAVATIVANKVHYIGAGTTTITASQAGSSNYTAAVDVARTLTVIAMPIAAWNFWTSGSTTQTNVVAYLYDSGLDATTNNTGLPATNSATSLPPKNITRGAGVSASGGTSTVRSTGFPNNAPTAPTVDASNTKYFQVTLQAGAAGKTVSLSTINAFFYDAGNGFNNSPGAISQFGYSLDGGTTIVPIGSPVQSTALRMGQIDVSGIAALQDVPFGTTITLRYYASGYASQGWGLGSPNPGGSAGIAATDGLVIGGDVSDSTTWTTGLVWTNGIPSATKNAIILGAFDTSISTGGSFTAKKLTVNAGGSLLIKAGTSITVQNQVINNAGANGIVVEDTGSLIQVNDVTPANNAGVIKYSRQTTPISNFDYTYWSSPVAGFTLGGVSPNTLADKFYSYNSTTQAWKQETSATAMTPGVGYIIRGPQLYTYMSPNPPAIYQATFSGVPNNGRYQISGMVANKLYLIGNPYPSALDADTFIDGNLDVLDGTLYFWTHNTPIGLNSYFQNDYASYNRTGGISTASAALNPGVSSSAPTGKIASGQGFFVNGKNPALTNGDTTIDFSNSMRVGVGGITGNNSQFFKSNSATNTIEKNRVWLNLSNTGGAFKQTLVGYVTGATNDFDNVYDGETLDSNQYVNFYSINQSKNLVIQGRALPFDENDVVPLGFKTTITGPLTISLENTDGLFVNQNVFIEDLLTNTITNLKNENYTFNATPGTYNDRFVLRYTNNALGLNNNALDSNSIIVYKNNDNININSGKLVIDNVKVYDLQGRLVLEQKDVNATTTSIKNLKVTQQVLIVKVTTHDNMVVTKKVIN